MIVGAAPPRIRSTLHPRRGRLGPRPGRPAVCLPASTRPLPTDDRFSAFRRRACLSATRGCPISSRQQGGIMDVRALLIILAVAAWPAHAQQVYKCVSGKSVSYQSSPCSSGAAAKAWDATPVPEPSNAELWRRYRMQQELDRRYAAQHSGGGGYGANVSSSQSGDACESAKRQRAAVYEAAGLKRSFEVSSQMDNLVHNACK